MADLADRALHTLSDGQLQRTLIAHVILQGVPLILLDEPLAAVGQTTEAHLLSIIRHWRSKDRAVVLVVPDLSYVLDHCSHALLAGNGEATEGRVQRRADARAAAFPGLHVERPGGLDVPPPERAHPCLT